MDDSTSVNAADGIAIIGMAGRFPGASTVDELWQNLQAGVESISFFSDEELLAAGVDPAALGDPHYVKAGGVLKDIEWFDAAFFGYTPIEAEIMDPQHRLFLECAWEALEHAGYDPARYKGAIGVYAGVGMPTYLLSNVLSHPELLESLPHLQWIIGNDKDFVPTRVSYKLNLRGPSVTVQTACSSSLVAVHLAVQSLLSFECDMALAGGVSILVPQIAGYWYQEGGIYSPDGHCRAFDAQAKGTVGGRGVGIVVLKRLQEALADGDCIHAVILGSAVNNDGSGKIGYTAPSVEGQAQVIAEAQAMAGVDPETITYIEAHGTGTSLGDPIEVAALTQVFRARTRRKGFCAIGSLKTNIGHLDTAAGVAGLIKTVLALEAGKLPPSLHFEHPNPEIDFANSPFYVNTKLAEWTARPRRAGVSSFGIGGTNAHVVVEHAPPRDRSGDSRPWQLITLSAKTPAALEKATKNLAEHLRQHPELNLADVAYTLHVGRQEFNYRRLLLCRQIDEAVAALEQVEPQRVWTEVVTRTDRPVAFMFPGQGAQYVNMGLELYQTEPTFRHWLDRGCELLIPHLGLDLRQVLYPSEEAIEVATRHLTQTQLAQPALFVMEYALAQLWMSWGVRPQAMIGHSIGEYVAACLAGVLSLEEALALVATRGRLMQQLPGGAMLAVPLPVEEVEPWLGDHVSVAAINEPRLCVVSGPNEAIEQLEAQLAARGVSGRRLYTSHAFHSAMMEAILEPFAEQVRQVRLHPPQIPYISNLTGTWISAAEATEPHYWARQLRHTVRLADGIGELLREPERVLLEVGPGRTLSSSAERHPAKTATHVIVSCLRHPRDRQSDVVGVLKALGRLWLSGVRVDWSGFYAHERRHRLPLPTYPFDRQRYWIEPGLKADHDRARALAWHKKPDVADWFYVPSWKRTAPSPSANSRLPSGRWLVFCDDSGLGAQIVERLERQGQLVVTVTAGEQFAQLGDRAYRINPRQPQDYKTLIQMLSARQMAPDRIAHLWGVTPPDPLSQPLNPPSAIRSCPVERGFYSLLFLVQALGDHHITHPLHIAVTTSQVQEVIGDEPLCPEKAMALGPCKVVPQEYPNITCRSIDLVFPESGRWSPESVDQLMAELTSASPDVVVAYRGSYRWVQSFEPLDLEGGPGRPTQLRQRGVYLITGGLGGIGSILAEYLARTVQAKLILTGRTPLPSPETWARWLTTHDETDGQSRKLRHLQTLQELGAEVLVASADVADLEQMQAVIKQANERFGGIQGVIHAAGLMDDQSFTGIHQTTPAQCEQHFRPKVQGLRVLEQVLRGQPLDFCLLVSSLSSVLGGLGFVAYAAANTFMDAFAYQHHRTGQVSWMSVNWDGWKLPDDREPQTARQAALAALAITPSEGIRVFERLLQSERISQVVVSTGDLSARLNQWIYRASGRTEADLTSSPESGPSRVEIRTTPHARPALPNAYVAPRTEVEQTIASVWQTLLGIESVGAEDNFFDLGGHSLLAIQVISRLREAFQVELSVQTLFDAPTVAQLAACVEAARQPAAREVERVAELLQLVENLSDAEVRALLSQQDGSPEP